MESLRSRKLPDKLGLHSQGIEKGLRDPEKRIYSRSSIYLEVLQKIQA
jgi:hypothetical protein